MREILFRGKRYDGVWMEGGLFMHDPVRVCLSNEKKPAEPMIITDGFCDWGFEPPMLVAKVIPETVGQFTGLTDKNGKKIFEGDICTYPDGWVDYAGDGVETFSVGVVAWDEKNPSFYLTDNIGVEWDEIWDAVDEITVIGNIHDNPELLEVSNG